MTIKHREAAKKHAARRLRERKGIDDPDLLKRLTRIMKRYREPRFIRDGVRLASHDIPTCRQNGERLIAVVRLDDKQYRVVYDMRLKAIVTVLA